MRLKQHGLLLFLLSTSYSAAVADNAIIQHCKQATSAEARIHCLEAAILMQSDRPADLPAPVADSSPAESQAAVTNDKVESTDAPSISAEPPPAAAAAPAEEIASGIGAEQVIARQQTQEEMLASLDRAANLAVADYATVGFEKLQVTLENGQVWRQIRGDTQIIRVNLRKNQTVDIEESSFGGYKLRLNEMRRVVRVQRIR